MKKKLTKVSCKECRRSFISLKSDKRKFCSRDCYVKDWTRRVAGWNKGKWYISQCKECGKEFANGKKGFHKILKNDNKKTKTYQAKKLQRLSKRSTSKEADTSNRRRSDSMVREIKVKSL